MRKFLIFANLFGLCACWEMGNFYNLLKNSQQLIGRVSQVEEKEEKLAPAQQSRDQPEAKYRVPDESEKLTHSSYEYERMNPTNNLDEKHYEDAKKKLMNSENLHNDEEIEVYSIDGDQDKKFRSGDLLPEPESEPKTSGPEPEPESELDSEEEVSSELSLPENTIHVVKTTPKPVPNFRPVKSKTDLHKVKKIKMQLEEQFANPNKSRVEAIDNLKWSDLERLELSQKSSDSSDSSTLSEVSEVATHPPVVEGKFYCGPKDDFPYIDESKQCNGVADCKTRCKDVMPHPSWCAVDVSVDEMNCKLVKCEHLCKDTFELYKVSSDQQDDTYSCIFKQGGRLDFFGAKRVCESKDSILIVPNSMEQISNLSKGNPNWDVWTGYVHMVNSFSIDGNTGDDSPVLGVTGDPFWGNMNTGAQMIDSLWLKEEISSTVETHTTLNYPSEYGPINVPPPENMQPCSVMVEGGLKPASCIEESHLVFCEHEAEFHCNK